MGSTEESGELPPEQIMEKARVSPHQWEVLQNYVEEPVSLETAIRDEAARVIDLLPDRRTASPSEVAMRKELSQEVRKTLKMLSPREEGVIKQRFGIDHGTDYTLAEIGKQLGICRERVRQIEKKALEKLKSTECEKDLKNLTGLYG